MRMAMAGIIVIMMFSCKNDDGKDLPEGIMGQEEIVPIIYDLMLADEYHNEILVKDSLLPAGGRLKKYEQVFQLHKTNYEAFSTSYKYYLSRPDLLKPVFDSVESYAGKVRARIYNSAKKTAP